MKIRVMGLLTCSRCEKLKESLKKAEIEHSFSDCDKDPENCDALESIVGSIHYPMVLISDLEDNILEIVFIASNYESLSQGVKTIEGIRLVPNHSVDELFRYTVNRLNLNLI